MLPFAFTNGPTQEDEQSTLVVRVGASVATKNDLFAALGRGLAFPDYFGNNWDALDEVLRDLHWVAAHRIVIAHDRLPNLAETDLRTYLDILIGVVEGWHHDHQHDVVVTFPEDAELVIRRIIAA